jgi:L-serine dehydratase
MKPDDERLVQALDLAKGAMDLRFEPIDLGPQAHPNSVRVDLSGPTRSLSLTAASIGGGSVCLLEIDGYLQEIHGTLETLVLWHQDTPGFLARVTAVLACLQLNVATIRTSRRERGETAVTAVEIDGALPAEVSALLRKAPAITRVAVLAPLPGY